MRKKNDHLLWKCLYTLNGNPTHQKKESNFKMVDERI